MKVVEKVFLIVVVMTILIVTVSVTGYGAILFPVGGGEIYGDVITIKGDTILFKLKPANTVVPFPIKTIDKISFDENTKDGVGLILSNGINFKDAVPLSFDGKQFVFKLKFATLIITDPKAVSFLSIQNIKETVPLETEKVWSLTTEKNEYVKGDLLLYKNGVYIFKTKYGNLQVPEDDILLISRVGKNFLEVGINIAGNAIKGNIDEFKDGKFKIKTDYGWLENVDEDAVTGMRYQKKEEKQEKGEMYLLLKDGEKLMGKVMSWSGGTLVFKSNYGQLIVDEDMVMNLKYGNTFGTSNESNNSNSNNNNNNTGYNTNQVQVTPNIKINIDTEPTGTEVWLDNKKMGKAPITLENIKNGQHNLYVKVKKDNGWSTTTTPSNNQNVNNTTPTIQKGDIWTKAAPMPTARRSFGAVVCGGKIYAIGGYSGSSDLNTVEVYDPKTNTWSEAAPMPTARRGLAAVEYGGKIYAIGGWNSSSHLNTVEVYDPKTNTWSKAAPMPTARDNLAAVVYGGKIYAIGGWNGDYLNTVEVYDPKSNTWSEAAPMPTTRSYLVAVEYGGKIYTIGGYKYGSKLNTVEVYDPKTNTWSKAAPMPTARNNLAAIEYGGKIYTIGGSNGSPLNTIEIYDPKTDTWSKAAPMPTARRNLAAVEYGGKIYAIGGYNGSCLNTVEVYIPAD